MKIAGIRCDPVQSVGMLIETIGPGAGTHIVDCGSGIPAGGSDKIANSTIVMTAATVATEGHGEVPVAMSRLWAVEALDRDIMVGLVSKENLDLAHGLCLHAGVHLSLAFVVSLPRSKPLMLMLRSALHTRSQ